jgi:hypothetical protein
MIKKLLKNVIYKTGYLLVKPTPKDQVKFLIEKLHPFQTDKGLIRLGPNGDGGYLVPNDLDGIKACFSPGVDQISEFEQDCLLRGMKIYMADKSVDKPNLNIPADQYDFIKKHVGCTNNLGYITMETWVNSVGYKDDDELLLQMDIEGGEYYSLINMPDSLMKRFRILVIEFHTLDELWNLPFFRLAEVVFDKVLQTHSCVHIHPNNDREIYNFCGIGIPRTAEFIFLRNDRDKFETYCKQFPHELDFDNSDKRHIALPSDWYKS